MTPFRKLLTQGQDWWVIQVPSLPGRAASSGQVVLQAFSAKSDIFRLETAAAPVDTEEKEKP